MSIPISSTPAGHDGDLRRAVVGDLELDLPRLVFAVVEVAAHLVTALLGHGPARRIGREGAQEEVEEPLLGRFRGALGDARAALLLDEADRGVHEVARDGVDVAADVADLRELRRLDLDERRVHEAREPPGDLRLADARRSDHEDVLRRRVARELERESAGGATGPERDRDGALRLRLADDVAVQPSATILRGDRSRSVWGVTAGFRP